MRWPRVTRRFRAAIVAAALVGASACQTGAPSDAPQPGSGVVDLTLSDGDVQRVLYLQPEHPAAVIVALVGGDGWLFIDGAGRTIAPSFLVTNRDDWLAQGVAVAYLHSPQPQYGRRSSERYARILTAVVAYARTRTDAPIWLVGHSLGSVAAVSGAAHMTHGEIAGVVLMASATRLRGMYTTETVFNAGLDRVNVPTLIVSHVGDTCIVTPPDDAPTIRAALTHAPKSEVMMVDGGTVPTQIEQCLGGGQHSFQGMQTEVIGRVAAWIKARRTS